jgi:hypothetical protein
MLGGFLANDILAFLPVNGSKKMVIAFVLLLKAGIEYS